MFVLSPSYYVNAGILSSRYSSCCCIIVPSLCQCWHFIVLIFILLLYYRAVILLYLRIYCIRVVVLCCYFGVVIFPSLWTIVLLSCEKYIFVSFAREKSWRWFECLFSSCPRHILARQARHRHHGPEPPHLSSRHVQPRPQHRLLGHRHGKQRGMFR